MIKPVLRHPALVGFLVLTVLVFFPLRAETLRGPGGLPPGLVAAMLGGMKGESLDARGCARLGDLRGCFGQEGARFREAGKELELRAVAWGREGRLEKLRWRRVGKDGNREVYRGRGIEAWWRAVPLGYEEGFELLRRPQGRGPVEVELEADRVGRKVGGGLRWGEVRYGKLWVTDARGRRVPAELRAEGRRIWIRIKGRGWRYPLRVDPLVWVEQAASLPTGLSGADGFGTSVALSGDGGVGLVGVPGTNNGVGAAYVYTYENSTGTWSAPVALTVPGGAGVFGASVALSGDGEVAIVGAYGTNNNVGAAYVYTYDVSTGTWSAPVALTVPSGAADFGFSVALSGDGEVAIVGAYGTNNDVGAAYIYSYSGGSWSAPIELTLPSNLALGDGFGVSVALSGNGEVALVGAPDTNNLTGAVYIYTCTSNCTSATGWSSTPVTLSGPSGANGFGSSGALTGDGEVAFVGAPRTNNNTGVAYFYGAADLDLVFDAPSAESPGGQYTEQAILTNESSYATPDLVLNLPVPVGTNYQDFSVTSSIQSSCTPSSSSGAVSSVSCDAGSLAANGGMVSASLTLGVPSNTAAGTVITEAANVANTSPFLSAQATTAVAIVPTLSGLKDETVAVGQTLPSESFTIGGTGTLTVTASSSNTALLPDSGIAVSSGCDTNGASCTLTLSPASGQVGTATVAVTVEDGYGQETSAGFSLTVNPPPVPTISGLKDETVTVGKTVPAETFTIGGTGTLVVAASSSNTGLLPDSGITGYTSCTKAGSCTLTLVPASGQVGTTAVTVTVEDGYGQETSAGFALTVQAVEGSPSMGTSGGGGGCSVGVGMLLGLLVVVGFKKRLRGRRA